jgi:uncharacterized protein YutE (UPF0331/DUF86 family)
LYSRLKLLEENLVELEKIHVQFQQEPEFFSKKTNEWSLRYGILESIQIIIDIACHLVTKYNLGNPSSYSNCVEILIQYEYIPKSLGQNIQSMIRLRNLLDHEHLQIDVKKLGSYLDLLGDFREFIKSVRSYL